MKIRLTEWYERSQSVERGPLVYALRLEEKWQWNDNVPANGRLDKGFWEVHTTSPWNYALIARDPAKMEEHYRVAVRTDVTSYPWNISGAPLEIRTKGKKIPDWIYITALQVRCHTVFQLAEKLKRQKKISC